MHIPSFVPISISTERIVLSLAFVSGAFNAVWPVTLNTKSQETEMTFRHECPVLPIDSIAKSDLQIWIEA